VLTTSPPPARAESSKCQRAPATLPAGLQAPRCPSITPRKRSPTIGGRYPHPSLSGGAGECASAPERARPPAAACSLSSAPSLGPSTHSAPAGAAHISPAAKWPRG
jgi:hypothetical protein